MPFLPYVQRFLYGDGVSGRSLEGGHKGSPMRILERSDVAAVRVAVRETDPPVTLQATRVGLTVVTVFGMIGSVTTGFPGMNLLAEADAPIGWRMSLFCAVVTLTAALTLYTMAKSKRLSDFRDALSDERPTVWMTAKALAAVWRCGA